MKSYRSHEELAGPGESLDAILNGRLRFIQPKKGYRFSMDALLLAEFVSVRPGDMLVDLGTGCGVIPLVLLLTSPLRCALGLEIQKDLAGQAARNLLINGLSGKMAIVLGDIRHAPLSEKTADIVTCNPPYRRAESGRINPDFSKAVARHEILASLDDILGTARRLLKRKGRLAMIYPAERLADLITRCRRFNLEPKKLQIVYPSLHSSAKLALMEALLGGQPGLDILEPVIGQGDPSLKTPF
jgi:tRNA1Val (adenine37-N6)-methyltransferase